MWAPGVQPPSAGALVPPMASQRSSHQRKASPHELLLAGESSTHSVGASSQADRMGSVSDVLVRGSASGNVFNHRRSLKDVVAVGGSGHGNASLEANANATSHRIQGSSLSPLRQKHLVDNQYGALPQRTMSDASVTSDGSIRVGRHMPIFMRHHRVAFAVIFAIFMNLLDACTFGTILFPVADLGQYASVGISSYLLSTAVVQVVLNCMSEFRCGLGTSQAENIPFLHLMATGVVDAFAAKGLGPDAAMPTILVCYSISTFMVGILFYATGYAELGKVLHYFPRHVIVGCISGFGVFLCVTGLEISSGLALSDMSLPAALTALMGKSVRWLWMSVVPLLAALRALERLEGAEMLTPLFMMAIPAVFYGLLWAVGMDIEEARSAGWLFPIPPPGNFYDMWTLFDFGAVDWQAIGDQVPTMLSLSLFLLVLIPIRIPSLSMSAKEEVDFDMEVKAQGLANILAGAMGSVHNYLCYSNSIFFHSCGGRGRFAQWFIAAGSVCMFMVGPGLITYIPRCVAGCVMASVGLDLMYDALWASRKQFDMLEYCTVILITVVIALLGFVSGIAVGVVLACVAFTLQSSRAGAPVRSIFQGASASVRSNTLYGPLQEAKLDRASPAVHVFQLQGNIFFGNVQGVLESIQEELLQSSQPMSSGGSAPPVTSKTRWVYCIVDCTHVVTADSTALAALAKLQRMVREEWVPPVDLALAGMDDELVAQLEALQLADGLLEEEGDGRGDPELTDADETDGSIIVNHPDINQALRTVEEEILSALEEEASDYDEITQQPITAMLGHLVESSRIHAHALSRLSSLLRTETIAAGTVLWREGDPATRACFLLRGELKAEYGGDMDQAILPGNLIGEIELLRGSPRTANVMTVEDSVIASLWMEQLDMIAKEDFEVLCAIQHIALMKDAGATPSWSTI
jgi:SulP family sulfate permease